MKLFLRCFLFDILNFSVITWCKWRQSSGPSPFSNCLKMMKIWISDMFRSQWAAIGSEWTILRRMDDDWIEEGNLGKIGSSLNMNWLKGTTTQLTQDKWLIINLFNITFDNINIQFPSTILTPACEYIFYYFILETFHISLMTKFSSRNSSLHCIDYIFETTGTNIWWWYNSTFPRFRQIQGRGKCFHCSFAWKKVKNPMKKLFSDAVNVQIRRRRVW